MKIKLLRNTAYLLFLIISFVCIQYIPEQEMKNSLFLCQENNNCEAMIKIINEAETLLKK